MKFLVDTQLPSRLAQYLTDKGDDEIVVLAKQELRSVVTKDSDFLNNFMLKGAPPKILLLEFGNISNKDLILLFEQYLSEVMSAFQEGSNLVVFRKTEVIGY